MSSRAATLAIAAGGSAGAPHPPPPGISALHSNGGGDLPATGISHTFSSDDPHASHHPDAWNAASHLQLLCLLLGQFESGRAPTQSLKP